MKLDPNNSLQRSYRGVAAVIAAIITFTLFGSLFGAPIYAKQERGASHLSAAADLTSRLQVTNTTDITDTQAMTDTVDTTDRTVTPAVSPSTTTTDTTSMMTGGDAPERALVPSGEESTLAPGARRWYIFQYTYDGEGEPSNAIVELRMAQPGSVSFEVWSQDDVSRWRNGEDFTPTGAGTPAFAIEEGDNADNRDRSLLRWVGNAEASLRFYIIVRNNSAAPASFTLTVSGPTVSFLTPDSAASGTESGSAEMTNTPSMTATVAMTGMAGAAPMTGMMQGGTGPDDAVSPTGQRETLESRARRWYIFQYSYDGEGDASNVITELRMAQPGSVSFEVWSQDDVNRWRNGEDFTPTGAGTPAFAIEESDDADDRDPSLLRWVGNAEASVRFYIIVRNTSDTTAAYRLTVNGPTVSFLAPALGDTTAMTDTAAMTETMATSDTMATDNTVSMTTTASTDTTDMGMTGGSGPEDTLVINGQRTTIEPGTRRWYTFEYTYDEETDSDGVPSNAIVELRMAQPDSVSFEVWTADNVRQWQNSEEFTPAGAGTPAFAIAEDDESDNRDRSLLRWVGNSEASVRYYIIVENNTDAPASYRLTVSGPDVRN